MLWPSAFGGRPKHAGVQLTIACFAGPFRGRTKAWHRVLRPSSYACAHVRLGGPRDHPAAAGPGGMGRAASVGAVPRLVGHGRRGGRDHPGPERLRPGPAGPLRHDARGRPAPAAGTPRAHRAAGRGASRGRARRPRRPARVGDERPARPGPPRGRASIPRCPVVAPASATGIRVHHRGRDAAGCRRLRDPPPRRAPSRGSAECRRVVCGTSGRAGVLLSALGVGCQCPRGRADGGGGGHRAVGTDCR
jgi:hypothetical protein